MIIRTPITYYGGKQTMLTTIMPIIPPHRIYVEPFFGGGAVFFAKSPSYLEVINDSNNRLITFYEVMRDRFDELNELITTTLHSETMYLKAKDIYNNRISGSELEIAWSVWVLTNMSFTGNINGGWKWCNGKPGSHSGRYIKKRSNEFKQLHHRLSDVQISSRDALKVIIDRDTPDTFFYLDPPYPGTMQKHYSGYSMKAFVELLEIIQHIKGKFLLSNFWSQTLKVYSINNDWDVIRVTKQSKVSNFQHSKYKTEILVRNYAIELNLFSSRNQHPVTSNKQPVT